MAHNSAAATCRLPWFRQPRFAASQIASSDGILNPSCACTPGTIPPQGALAREWESKEGSSCSVSSGAIWLLLLSRVWMASFLDGPLDSPAAASLPSTPEALGATDLACAKTGEEMGRF